MRVSMFDSHPGVERFCLQWHWSVWQLFLWLPPQISRWPNNVRLHPKSMQQNSILIPSIPVYPQHIQQAAFSCVSAHLAWFDWRIIHSHKVRWYPVAPPQLPWDAPVPDTQKVLLHTHTHSDSSRKRLSWNKWLTWCCPSSWTMFWGGGQGWSWALRFWRHLQPAFPSLCSPRTTEASAEAPLCP